MGRTWEYVYGMSEDGEDTEHLIVEYRPGAATVTFIAHDPASDATVELVGMPFSELQRMYKAMYREWEADD